MMQALRAGESEPHGPGERIEQKRRRRRTMLFGSFVAIGFAIGIYIGATRAESLIGTQTDWPPALAIGLASVWVTVLLLGGFWTSRVVDEFELQRQYKAVAAAAAAYFLIYPVWFVLWKGGFVPEPSHGLLFILFWLALAAASLFYRFR